VKLNKTLCNTAHDESDSAHLVLQVVLDGREYAALLDSGAQGNYMSPRLRQRLSLATDRKLNPYQLRSAEGGLVQYNRGRIDEETAPLHIRIQRRTTPTQFDITEIGEWDIILGIPWLRKWNPTIDWNLGQIQWRDAAPVQSQNETTRHLLASTQRPERTTTRSALQQKYPAPHLQPEFCNDPQQPTLQERMKDIPSEYHQYAAIFQEELDTVLPEHSHYDHEIVLKEGTQPRFFKIYHTNEKQQVALDEYLEENLRKGYIRPSKSPAGYPILFVPKKNGKLRICIDYRQLNDITIKNCYPLPLISELRDLLVGAQYFTALDLKGAYNLIRMKEGEEWKTAFRTRRGHFEYLVMPFGLTNAPATFQTMINEVLRDFLDIFVVVYLDDILIFSRTLSAHKEHVHQVLQRLLEAKLLVEPEKTKFHVQEVDFLGYNIRPGEIRMDPKKIQTVRDWPTPQDLKDVRGFLGFVNFYRRFMKGYSDISRPLTNLTKKDQPFTWGEAEDLAFQRIRDQILSEPILRIPDPQLPFEVETDASDYALGGQLAQRDTEGRLHPVAFYSKKLHGPELNYQIHDKELMAIIEAFKEWKPYLSGTTHPVKVYTDHKNLVNFTTTKELNKRQTRWAEFLSEFNFTITYRKGSENGRADALSRRSDLLSTEVPDHNAILSINADGDLVPNERVLEVLVTTKETIEQLIRRVHSAPAHGHQGVWKTFQRLRQHHNDQITRQQVQDAIKDCDLCRKSKASRHKPYGEIQPLPVADGPWTSISWDFITDLPPSEEPISGKKYDSILVIVDRFTKYAYFLPYLKTGTAEDLSYVFLRNVASQHGMPKGIVSDRDKLFTSNFWKALMKQLGPDRNLSTAFHPQSDGQTERTNQTLEQYLRCYVDYQQENWVQLLPTAQFAYNSAPSESTKVSPFYANYGFAPTMYGEPREASKAPKATKLADDIRNIHDSLRDDLQLVRLRMTKYANQSRMKGPSFQEGDKVYLIRKNIKTKRPNNKLDFKKIGPFKILKKISETNFRLSLPENMKIHPVFHIALLEPAPDGVPLEHDLPADDTEEYTVERILDHRTTQEGQDEYLVKWEGYGHEENTWEPLEHLRNAQLRLRQFHQAFPTRTTRNQRRAARPRLTDR
jgi:hypothetical protein